MMNEWRIKDYNEWMKDKRLWWMNEGWKTMMNEWKMTRVVKNTSCQVSEGKNRLFYFVS